MILVFPNVYLNFFRFLLLLSLQTFSAEFVILVIVEVVGGNSHMPIFHPGLNPKPCAADG